MICFSQFFRGGGGTFFTLFLWFQIVIKIKFKKTFVEKTIVRTHWSQQRTSVSCLLKMLTESEVVLTPGARALVPRII